MRRQTHIRITNGGRLLIIAGLLLGSGVRADPVTALFSLLLVEKLAPDNSEQQGEPAPRGWREHLTPAELETLDTIRQHPAIDTCIAMADRHHPVAGYHAGKLARFGLRLQQHIHRSGALPEIASLDYRWPARAFRWCSREAGMATDHDTALLTHAYHIARVVLFHHRQPGMMALSSTR